jgi:hypothetical protein
VTPQAPGLNSAAQSVSFGDLGLPASNWTMWQRLLTSTGFPTISSNPAPRSSSPRSWFAVTAITGMSMSFFAVSACLLDLGPSFTA